MIAVKQVGDSYGHSRTGCFDGGEGGVIVDDVVGQKYFVAATTAKVQGRRVVQRTRSSDGSKQETVLAIPEAMFGGRQFCIDVAAARVRWTFRRITGRLRARDTKKKIVCARSGISQGISSQIRPQDERRGQVEAGDFATPDLDHCAGLRWRFGRSAGSAEKRETKHDT